MKEKVRVYYDKDGDFLEIGIGKPRKGYFEEIKDGVLLRKDEKTDKVIGFAIHGFTKRARHLKELKTSLPFTIEVVEKL